MLEDILKDADIKTLEGIAIDQSDQQMARLAVAELDRRLIKRDIGSDEPQYKTSTEAA